MSNARLDHADLKQVQLAEATLCGASLKGARNLTQVQIDQAYGDEDTCLPAGLRLPARWRHDTILRSNQLARRLTAKPDARKVDDPYAVLGIPRGVSLPEVRAAYLKLVKELHPDGRELDPMAGELLKAVNKAYQDLKARARQPAPQPPHPRWLTGHGAFFHRQPSWLQPHPAQRVGGLYYAGLFGADDGRQRLAAERRQQDPTAPAPVEAAGKPDPAQLAAARAAADDAAFLEAEREATSASFHRYLGRYSTGLHAQQAAAALPAVVNTEIALGQGLEGKTRTTAETARSALRHYLDVYPSGRLAREVERKLNGIAAAEAARVAEHAAWVETERLGTPEGLRRYLAVYPRGENAAYATKALAALEASQARRAADQVAWNDASREGSKASLRRYLAAYPDGDHAAHARTAVAAIEADEARFKADRAAWAKASQDGSKPALTRYLPPIPMGIMPRPRGNARRHRGQQSASKGRRRLLGQGGARGKQGGLQSLSRGLSRRRACGRGAPSGTRAGGKRSAPRARTRRPYARPRAGGCERPRTGEPGGARARPPEGAAKDGTATGDRPRVSGRGTFARRCQLAQSPAAQ